jgi:hypothetical protein
VAWQEKQLFQSRINGTSLTSVYSPPDSTTVIVKHVVIANTTAAGATFQLCIDDDGTTYSEATALYWTVTIPANSTLMIDCYICMNNTLGNIAFQNATANALTITGFGVEIT